MRLHWFTGLIFASIAVGIIYLTWILFPMPGISPLIGVFISAYVISKMIKDDPKD